MPIFLAALVAAFACSEGQAAFVINVNLTTSQEVPDTTTNLTNSSTGGVRPTPFGTATFTLDISNPNAPFLTFTATIFNIDVTGSQTPNDFRTTTSPNAHPCRSDGRAGSQRARRLGVLRYPLQRQQSQ